MRHEWPSVVPHAHDAPNNINLPITLRHGATHLTNAWTTNCLSFPFHFTYFVVTSSMIQWWGQSSWDFTVTFLRTATVIPSTINVLNHDVFRPRGRFAANHLSAFPHFPAASRRDHHEQKRNSELAHPSLPIDLSCFPHHPFLLAFSNPGLKGYSFCIMRHQIHTGTIACALKPGGGAHGWTTTPRYCLPRSSFSLQVRLWEEAVFSDSKVNETARLPSSRI